MSADDRRGLVRRHPARRRVLEPETGRFLIVVVLDLTSSRARALLGSSLAALQAPKIDAYVRERDAGNLAVERTAQEQRRECLRHPNLFVGKARLCPLRLRKTDKDFKREDARVRIRRC